MTITKAFDMYVWTSVSCTEYSSMNKIICARYGRILNPVRTPTTRLCRNISYCETHALNLTCFTLKFN
jgi:hypothetical protein